MTVDAVLFDCDGVLVDSEAITCGVLRDMLEELGWSMTLAYCMTRFVGHTVRSRWDLVQVALTDITARKKAEAYLEYLGKHDVLTKLGMNVELVSTDWGTVTQRCASKEPVANGG